MLLWRSSRLWLLVLCLGGSFLFLFTFSPCAVAASDPISVISRSDNINFPKNIDFKVSASDSVGPITQASIMIMSNASGTTEQHQFTVNPPAQAIALDWRRDITGNNFLSPGSELTYYWKFQDSAGNVHTDSQQSFLITDTRFSWQQISQGKLQIHWYNRSLDFGQFVLAKATSSVKRISDNLGSGLTHPINLWIYQSNDDFHGSLAPSTYEWVGGIALPSLDEAEVVVENTNSDTLSRDMPHELTHLIFHQLTMHGIFAPTWFDEGLAVYNQAYHEPQMALRLKEALLAHTLLHLRDISYDFPGDTSKAYLAYGQSWNMVDYMYSTFGHQKMAALVRAMNNPQATFDQDLIQALGMDEDHLENQWRQHLNQPALPTSSQPQTISHPQAPVQARLIDKNTIFLLLLGILLIFLPTLGISLIFVLQRRSRNKAQLAYYQSTMAPPHSYQPGYSWQEAAYAQRSGQHPGPPYPPSQRDVPQGASSNRQAYPNYPGYPPSTPVRERNQVRQNGYPPFVAEEQYSGYRPRRYPPQE
jgi:hypothetical protein